MAEPTSEEIKLLIEFRKRVSDILTTEEQKHDSFLLRWMRARELNLEKAEKMLRASTTWREENNVDELLKAGMDPYFLREFPYFLKGTDKLGQPVMVVKVGKWDCRKVVSQGKQAEFKQHICHMFETLMEAIRVENSKRDKGQYPLTQFTIICDWSGFPYSQLLNLKAVQALLQGGSIYEAYYPEVLYRAFYTNSPPFFGAFVEMLKTVCNARTLGKISIFRSDQKEWEKAMGEVIDVKQLSALLATLNDG